MATALRLRDEIAERLRRAPTEGGTFYDAVQDIKAWRAAVKELLKDMWVEWHRRIASAEAT